SMSSSDDIAIRPLRESDLTKFLAALSHRADVKGREALRNRTVPARTVLRAYRQGSDRLSREVPRDFEPDLSGS
ncbi:MAG TPA: hypothetical protein VGH65_00585, partial [Verrucomicrobiaceae bacterium]